MYDAFITPQYAVNQSPFTIHCFQIVLGFHHFANYAVIENSFAFSEQKVVLLSGSGFLIWIWGSSQDFDSLVGRCLFPVVVTSSGQQFLYRQNKEEKRRHRRRNGERRAEMMVPLSASRFLIWIWGCTQDFDSPVGRCLFPVDETSTGQQFSCRKKHRRRTGERRARFLKFWSIFREFRKRSVDLARWNGG